MATKFVDEYAKSKPNQFKHKGQSSKKPQQPKPKNLNGDDKD